jgi:2'-5' RNA ligase
MQTNNFYERVWEYQLVISPPDEVKRSIGKIKKEVGIKYGSFHTLHSATFISLVKFLLVKGYEKKLLSLLFSFCVNSLPFEIVLNNFGMFPYHTLYANIRESRRLNNLQDTLTALLRRSFSANEKFMRVSRKHHLTIAGNLNPIQFELIADEYRNKQINTLFKAKNVVMYKKPYENNSRSFRRYGSHNFVLGCC